MTASHLDDAFERWRSALLDALATPGNVMAWQDRRYQFAYQVGQLLVDSGPGIPPVSDHVVYGVYVTGGGLLYVGQTSDARRRLRDLPVGESHHLATTVPPETWERVLVIQWPALITRIPAQEAQRTEQPLFEEFRSAYFHQRPPSESHEDALREQMRHELGR